MSMRALTLLFVLALAAPVASAVPTWGAPASRPIGTAPATLAPGQWTWDGEAAPTGPVQQVLDALLLQ